MNKSEFLNKLSRALKDLPGDEVKRTMDYYSELIEDAVEDGACEAEFIAELGEIDEIAKRAAEGAQTRGYAKTKRKLSAAAIVLIIAGSPVWLPILLSVAIVALAVYLVLWTIEVSLFICDFSLAVCAVVSAVVSPFIIADNAAKAVFILGCAAVCAGICILGFFGSVQCGKMLVKLTAFAAGKLKHRFTFRSKEAEIV